LADNSELYGVQPSTGKCNARQQRKGTANGKHKKASDSRKAEVKCILKTLSSI